MLRTTIACVVLLMSTQFHAAPQRAATATRIVLDVHNNATTSNEALSQAEHAVGRLFATAGLSLQWRDGLAPAIPGAFSVTLLTDADAERVQEFRPELVLGVSAPPPLRRIRINAERVRYASVTYDCSEGALLGHVIGHETFHALGLAHAPRGLMRASPRTFGGLLDQTLTTREVDALQAAMHRDTVDK